LSLLIPVIEAMHDEAAAIGLEVKKHLTLFGHLARMDEAVVLQQFLQQFSE